MNAKENFKLFVKKNPNLLKYVQNGDMSWQKFYEMYDMYGEDDKIWNSYLNNNLNDSITNGLFDMIKNLDFDSIQTGVSSMQRVVSLLQDMTAQDNKDIKEYKPRPLYKHFED
ncbi:MAG: hypothetical protein IKJ43_03670 [Bacilli bacterium]|nr:hypothetical protein [Bacilli bacterium]